VFISCDHCVHSANKPWDAIVSHRLKVSLLNVVNAIYMPLLISNSMKLFHIYKPHL
jgi:hypothetical protein